MISEYGNQLLAELGVSGGTFVIGLIVLYFIVKWAVKNGVKEALSDVNMKEQFEQLTKAVKGNENPSSDEE